MTQLRRLHEYAQVPLIAKPNAGIPEIRGDETVYNCPPEQFTAHLQEMAEAGVRIFGGCCGTTAEHIRALKTGTALLQPAQILPQRTDLLPPATEKEVFWLDPAVEIGEVISCSEDLEEDLLDAMDEDTPVIALAIRETKDLELFAENQYMIRKPLCLVCEDIGLLEQALRLYQGRALYCGALPEEALVPLVRKYGLLLHG